MRIGNHATTPAFLWITYYSGPFALMDLAHAPHLLNIIAHPCLLFSIPSKSIPRMFSMSGLRISIHISYNCPALLSNKLEFLSLGSRSFHQSHCSYPRIPSITSAPVKWYGDEV